MHAAVTRVTVTEGEAATTYLREEIVPQCPKLPASSPATGSGSREGTKEHRSSFLSLRTRPAQRQTKSARAPIRILA